MSKNNTNTDIDIIETSEWLDALSSMIKTDGISRAKYVLERLANAAQTQGVEGAIGEINSYVNSINVEDEPEYPGDLELEAKIETATRWNAIAMVLRGAKVSKSLGGHISSCSSIVTAYEVGLNHFFKGQDNTPGDCVYYQGHSSEANYGRAYLEGRLSKDQLDKFRQEITGDGLSSYPHPWLMKDFWQFASVSLGLAPLQAIYQARFQKYLQHRELLDSTGRHTWCFIGDGEMDEVDSTGAITLASREKLNNLTYIINCNLQRLDGPVRSNYRVVQEYESLFRGAGWHIIRVMWGSKWDKLFDNDPQGLVTKRLSECVDGDLQNFCARDGAFIRENFFNTDGLKALVSDMSDDDLHALMLNRGGHDPVKIFAAFSEAKAQTDKPSLILMHAVKGYGLGNAAESQNIAHNAKDMSQQELEAFRDRFELPLTNEQLANYEYCKPDESSPEMQYMHAKRKQLDGFVPTRRIHSDESLKAPELSAFNALFKDTGDREMSSTMAVGRVLSVLLKDKNIKDRIVPIFSDEARTFGLEGLFRQVGIYSPEGQKYTPEDREQLVYYREDVKGQVLQEGITEAGCMASWMAAATSYSVNNLQMIPFFIYYSMFGFQRVGDLIWAAGDMRARGFLIGGTAGRTTLEGEGLQHQDGFSLVQATSVPNCVAYDPTFAYEMAVIIQNGVYRMNEKQEDVFFYITAMNEKYSHPAMPEGAEDGIVKGMYLFQAGDNANAKSSTKAKSAAKSTTKSKDISAANSGVDIKLLSSGAIMRETIAAAELLSKDFGISADIWSVTSIPELRRDGLDVQRNNMMNDKSDLTYVEQCLGGNHTPVICATDYQKSYGDLLRPFIDAPYTVLGTDGFGRSDTRAALRDFFEVDRNHIAYAAVYTLYKQGQVTKEQLMQAKKKYKIDSKKPNPVTV